jgi:hypothetical protein
MHSAATFDNPPQAKVVAPAGIRKSRSQPISRVLLRGALEAHPMAVIHLDVALPRRSSHLPADSASSLRLNLASAYLVLLRMEVAAFHPLRTWREPDRCDSSLWPCSSPSATARAIVLLRLGVTQHPALRSPDFPLPALVFTGGQRRSGWLRTRMVARRADPFSRLDFRRELSSEFLTQYTRRRGASASFLLRAKAPRCAHRTDTTPEQPTLRA